MSANREVLLTLAAIFFLLPNLVPAVAMPGLQTQMMADPEAASAVMNDLFADWGVLLVVVAIALVLAQILGYLAMLALLRDTSRPTVGEALKAGLGGLLPALGFYLIVAVAAFALALLVVAISAASPGLGVVVVLLCVVVAFYVMIKLSLVLAVIAIDKVGNPIAAMTRSWQLTKGNSFRLFLFFLLLGLVYIVIAAVIGMVLGALMLALGTSTALLVNGVISGILSAIVTVVFVAVIAAIHRQLAGPSAAAVSETFE
jgi:hypothetical protein